MSAELHDRIAELAAENARLREAIRPFADAVLRKTASYRKQRADWFDRMPGTWPLELRVTMDDGRRARELMRAAAAALRPMTTEET